MKLNPSEDIRVDSLNLSDEFRKYPAQLYRYSERARNAQNDYEDLKEAMKQLRSEEYLKIKTEHGKITQAHLDALIDTSEYVLSAKTKMLEAKREADTLLSYLEGFRSKKDAMVNIGANQRAEIK